jgi:hypothetical protein
MDTCCVFDIYSVPGFIDVVKNNFDETLKINKVNYKTKANNSYNIIRYNKNLITKDLIPTLGIIKSLVFNDDYKAIGFAPPKALDLSTFQLLYPVPDSSIIAEEFVEGVMINLFWNPKMNIDGGWEISTRNTVGGAIFCKNTSPKKTCSDLFKETIAATSLDIHELNKAYCYSFVMRHPTILNVAEPELYLVEIFEIVHTLTEMILVFQMNLHSVKHKIPCLKGSKIKFPKQYYNWSSYEELKDVYASINSPTSCMGVILRNKITGERSKILNPLQQVIMTIFRNGEKELYKYLVLRKEGKVKEFLQLNPNNKKMWSLFRKYIHDFTTTLHKNYLDCYVKKIYTIESFPLLFRRHLQNLHEIYIHNLVVKKSSITLEKIINYINTMNTDLLLYSLISPIREITS